MRFSVVAIAVGAMASSAAEPQVPSPPNPPSSPSLGFVEFDEPFADPGNETAKALAQHEGISVGEATRRLRLAHNAGRMGRRLAEQYPETYSGIAIDMARGARVTVHFEDAASTAARDRIQSASQDPELAAATEVRPAPRSRREARALGEQLRGEGRRLGLNFEVAVSAIDGSLKILAQDPQAVAAAVGEGRLTLPEATAVEQHDPILLTEDLHAGYSYNANDGDHRECTTGFVVMERVDLYGPSTAGHCGNTGRFNKNPSSTYSSGGVSLSFRQQWTSNDLDLQWHTFSYSTHSASPMYFNGAGGVYVSGGANAAPGDWLCKYGRTTGQTCGYVDAYEYSDAYGWFSRVNRNTTYPKINDYGDSGGPVYSGSLAAGWVHGKDSSGNMYFTHLQSIVSNNLPIRVLCSC